MPTSNDEETSVGYPGAASVDLKEGRLNRLQSWLIKARIRLNDARIPIYQ
jgi:hypothetical protein